MNKISFSGHLGKDPEVRMTNNGKRVATASLPLNKPYSSDLAGWVNLIVWDKRAEYLERYSHKGSFVCGVGYIQVREYTDRDGNKRTTTEIIADEIECPKENPTKPNETQKNHNIFDAIGDAIGEKPHYNNDEADLPF